MQAIICLGDSTSHGGIVIEAFGQTSLNGRPIAGKGHMVTCPQCKGTYPITEGSSAYSIDNTPVALNGMKTACGTSLIAGDERTKVRT